MHQLSYALTGIQIRTCWIHGFSIAIGFYLLFYYKTLGASLFMAKSLNIPILIVNVDATVLKSLPILALL